jgi:hypothetical protein
MFDTLIHADCPFIAPGVQKKRFAPAGDCRSRGDDAQPLAGINKLFADFHTVPLTAIGLFSVWRPRSFTEHRWFFWHLDREMIKLIQLKGNALGPPVLHHVRPDSLLAGFLRVFLLVADMRANVGAGRCSSDTSIQDL